MSLNYSPCKPRKREVSEVSTGKESQEEETDTRDLLVHVALRALLDVQLVHDRYLDLLHFVIQRSVPVRR